MLIKRQIQKSSHSLLWRYHLAQTFPCLIDPLTGATNLYWSQKLCSDAETCTVFGFVCLFFNRCGWHIFARIKSHKCVNCRWCFTQCMHSITQITHLLGLLWVKFILLLFWFFFYIEMDCSDSNDISKVGQPWPLRCFSGTTQYVVFLFLHLLGSRFTIGNV